MAKAVLGKLILLAVIVETGACASIVEGSSQTIQVVTNPPGAVCKFERNGEIIGVVNPTPAGLVVKKTKHDINVTCSKPGYQDAHAFLKSEIEGATWGNIILGGGIGWAIDSASGADNHYQDALNVSLVPVVAGDDETTTPTNDIDSITPAAGSTPPANATAVEARLKALKELYDKGLITKEEYEAKRREIMSSL